MTSSIDTLTPELDFETGLQKLISRGYRFVHPRDENGEVLEIVGIRMHDDVVDIVRLGAKDDVIAMRVPGDEDNVLKPSQVLWHATGPVASVLAETLALPEDRTPDWLVASA